MQCCRWALNHLLMQKGLFITLPSDRKVIKWSLQGRWRLHLRITSNGRDFLMHGWTRADAVYSFSRDVRAVTNVSAYLNLPLYQVLSWPKYPKRKSSDINKSCIIVGHRPFTSGKIRHAAAAPHPFSVVAWASPLVWTPGLAVIYYNILIYVSKIKWYNFLNNIKKNWYILKTFFMVLVGSFSMRTEDPFGWAWILGHLGAMLKDIRWQIFLVDSWLVVVVCCPSHARCHDECYVESQCQGIFLSGFVFT